MYGLPGPDAWAAARRGEIILGGCIVGLDDEPALRRCSECGWFSVAHTLTPFDDEEVDDA